LGKKLYALLLLTVVAAMVVAGCTTSSPATTPATGTTVKPTTAPTTAPATGKNYATVWPTIAAAETGPGDLHGKITSASTKAPLKDAVVYIWKEADAYDDKAPAFAKAVTDANGEYKISNIPNGYYQIRITALNNPGYDEVPLEEVDGPTEYNEEVMA
jgi:protocatechuate 3,4-dioxygenase beta subunit